MTLPQHQNPTAVDREATAPYNFVPLPSKITPATMPLPGHDRYDPDGYTGHIRCQLTTASPLYIRCGESPADFSKDNTEQSPEFFTDPLLGQPLIPGSSLRGMVRAMVEIVSYGKVQPVSHDPLVYRVIGDQTSFGDRYRERLMQEDGRLQYTPLLQAGYMEKQGFDWVIRPAQTIEGSSFARILINNVPRNLQRWYGCKNAYKIWVKPGPYGYKNVRQGFIKVKFSDILETAPHAKEPFIEAVHVHSGRMFSKKFDRVIYAVDQKAAPIPVAEPLIQAYREQISQEQVKILGKNGVLQDKQPVFYLVEGGELVFFGHTMMLRLPYQKSPKDFVPAFLQAKDQVDFAEAIFGYTGLKVSPEAQAGRVSVLDARLAAGQHDIFLSAQPITPKILSGPKPTTIQHYLTQQTPDEQVVGQTKDGRPKTQLFLSHYASATPAETVIRGHKLYWNKGKNPAIENDDDEASETQLTKIKPLKPGVIFDFTLHFENLSELELGALLWVLKLGADENYRLKLGMGKPLGMGAVKTEPTLYLTRRKTRYATLFEDESWQLGQHQADDVLEQAPQAFEAFIKGNHADAFGGHGRLEQLRALLSWPGPAADKTAYITDLKEFKSRKVLPTPRHVHPFKPIIKAAYGQHFVFMVKLEGKWDPKIKGLRVKMPNGEEGRLTIPSRKKIKPELGHTLELVVRDVKNGIYILDFH